MVVGKDMLAGPVVGVGVMMSVVVTVVETPVATTKR